MSPDQTARSDTKQAEPVIALILAGGAGRRMGGPDGRGTDKGAVMLGARRLVDHVMARLAPQVDEIALCGPHDYETGLTAIADRDDGPAGPAAGLWAGAHWVKEHRPAAHGVLTVPVDAPFLPRDLAARLCGDDCAIAADEARDHPSIAWWEIAPLLSTLSDHRAGAGIALHDLARQCEARRILFSPAWRLSNINTAQELTQAEARLRRKGAEEEDAP